MTDDTNAAVEVEDNAAVADNGNETTTATKTTATTSAVHRLKSSMTSGMESSVLKFQDIHFLVGGNNENKKKHILTNVSGKVKSGRVLAIMGPSGAGKTTLINALTLNAHYGVATGSVKLNGVPLSPKIFREHCFVVPQQDKHWPYLTCRETLQYATRLYQVVERNDKEQVNALVEELMTKLGLIACADQANYRLSNGQRRRLSIAVALVKQPRVLVLDEPTSGLDAAAAMNIMQEIVRVARDEKLITICTIHQPSTKVYNQFDQIMLLSRGRTAFTGDVNQALPYFDATGHPIPPNTNPAEFFLDLVNSDFSDETAVTEILNDWEEAANQGKRPGGSMHNSGHGGSSHHGKDDEDDDVGVVNTGKASLGHEIPLLFHRHSRLILRDPILYLGRCVVFLVACLVFALVYLKARDDDQSQVQNKFWLCIWLLGVPSQMGVVAVYALNDEFKSLLMETKNGMLTGASYVIAKSILVLPIMYLFSLFSVGIPFYAVFDAPPSTFGICTVIYACALYVFESVAEALSVWFDDPILGMLQYMNFWFGAFLFGGFLIPLRDLYWPFTLFYYIEPYAYHFRSFIHNYMMEIDWKPCNPIEHPNQPVCLAEPTGAAVLDELHKIFPLVSSDDDTTFDILILIVIGSVFKLFYIIGVLWRTSTASKFQQLSAVDKP